MYLSWKAAIDYFDGHYKKALEALEPALQRLEDKLWAISMRGYIYRELGDDEAAMNDVLWIWDRRDDSNYKAHQIDFAWAAFWQGMVKKLYEEQNRSLRRQMLRSEAALDHF